MQLENELANFFKIDAPRYKVIMAFLYGSYAGGFPRRDSDVDLAVGFDNEVKSDEDAFFLITDISYRLTDLLGREVNVISVDRNFSHPMLYYNAIVSGKPVFIGNYDRYVALILEAIYQMEDFQIFGVAWQQEAARKNMEGFDYAGI